MIKQLDPLVIDKVVHHLPCYADSRVESRYHSASSKRIAAWLRFPRRRNDGLFDCLHFARDYVDGDGFLYSAEGYLSFFPELPYPPGPFGDYFVLQDALREAHGGVEDSPVGEFWGGSWYLLGQDLKCAEKRLTIVLELFADVVLPLFDTTADALLHDPMLMKALEFVETADVEATDAKDRVVSELRTLGEKDQRGYPAGKIAGQLVLRKRGNKRWYAI